MIGMPIDVTSIEPASITELKLQGHGDPLNSDTLAWLARLTSLQKLNLCGWRSSSELADLAHLPIQEFTSDQGALPHQQAWEGTPRR